MSGGQVFPVPLHDAPFGTWVLRGGFLTSPSREKNLRSVHEAYDVWGICVKAEPGRLPNDIARRGQLGSKTMMVSLSHELEEAGFRVVQEPWRNWPSALVLFPGEPSDDDWTTLRGVMMQRQVLANPAYRGK